MMDSAELDKKIEFAERRVLAYQGRIIEKKDEANLLVKRLEREAKSQDGMKKEWIKKKNLEEERKKVAFNELKKSHRHVLEDLRLKYEQERSNKLRELKTMIQEEETEIREWQRKRSEAAMKTRAEEAEIKAKYQVKINELLRDEQAVSKRGVVRQKRLLAAPNIYSMSVEKRQPVGMKRRHVQRGVI